MMSWYGLLEITIQTFLIFAAFFTIGLFLRGQALGGHVEKILIFFAIVALVGGLMGARYAPIAIASRSATHR